MFSKFSSILHHAVEALAPQTPKKQDFQFHWKALTYYFIQNKDHKTSVEHTSIPSHLDAMLSILEEEEKNLESGSTGPCMEYLLQHKILETIYSLARNDCPPGMKQQVLQFFTKLLLRTNQPILPHINVHKAVQRLVRLCGEVAAAPSENEEIQFLCMLCAKIRQQPYLVNFFIESHSPVRLTDKNKISPLEAGDGAQATEPPKVVFTLMDSLLKLMTSPDARVCVKACEGLMLCASLPDHTGANCIVENTQFSDTIVAQLCSLYEKLPTEMDPADIDSVEAKWGLDVLSDTEDYLNFPGKRQLISFLSWLDFCDQLIYIAHPTVGVDLAKQIHKKFLTAIIEPRILQTFEAGATTATAHLSRCLKLAYSPLLLNEFVTFTLGNDKQPEKHGIPGTNKVRNRLIERCDHLSEELSITTLKLFETLLQKPNQHVVYNLVLRNLLGRNYCVPSHEEQDKTNQEPSPKQDAKDTQNDSHKLSEDNKESKSSNIKSPEQGDSDNTADTSNKPIGGNEEEQSNSHGKSGDGQAIASQNVDDLLKNTLTPPLENSSDTFFI